jgi:hypothetical protein
MSVTTERSRPRRAVRRSPVTIDYNPEGINQYTGASSSDAGKASAAAVKATAAAKSPGGHAKATVAHAHAAKMHEGAAKNAPNKVTERWHPSMATAHRVAAKQHGSGQKPTVNFGGHYGGILRVS